MASSDRFEYSHIAVGDYIGFNHLHQPAPTLYQFIQQIQEYRRKRKNGFIIPILCWISGVDWGPPEYADGYSHYITGFFSVTNPNYSAEYQAYGVIIGFGYDNNDLGDLFAGSILFGDKEDLSDCTIKWRKIH